MPASLPPDAGDSPDPEGTTMVLTPEAPIVLWIGTPPETCAANVGDWTSINPSTGVDALLD